MNEVLPTPITDALVTEFLKRIQSRSRQELIVRLEDKVKPPLEDLKDRVARRIWMLSQHWMEWGADEPILYPTGSAGGTKLYYRKGTTAVLLYEQSPQIRAVVFAPELIAPDADEPGRKFYLSLGFPHVVFAIHFVNGRYQGIYVFYLREALTSLHQRPLCPNLPNIDNNSMKVCHGDFSTKEYKDGDINGQSIGAIDHFWRSQFNGSWTELYKRSQTLDPRLATPRKWEAASKQNPMFPLGIEWPETTYLTFRHFLTRLFESDQKVQELNQKLFNDLVSETASELQTLMEGQVAEDPEITAALRKELVTVIGLLSKAP